MITPIIVPMQVSASRVEIPVSVAVSEVNIPMGVEVSYNIISGDWYDGAYDVMPKLTEQKLDTKNLLMRDDVTVYKIPVVQTSNPYGGQTVVIG